jgi:hypothetical protein
MRRKITMALKAELEALCAELDKVDPALGKAQRELLEKNEKAQDLIREGVLRQQDYSKFMNDNKAAIEDGKTMRDWAKTEVPKSKIIAEENRLARERIAELEKKVAESADAVARAAAGAGGTSVDPTVVTQAVMDKLRASGDMPTKTELADLVAAETKKQTEVAEKKFFESTFPSAARWQEKYTNAQLLHFQETGKPLDGEAFRKFMVDNKLSDDPEKAYAQFVGPAKTQKEIEKTANELAEKRYQDMLKERGLSGFPGTSGTPSAPGHFQVRLAKKDAGDSLISSNVELGDGALAAAAAAELSSEGK